MPLWDSDSIAALIMQSPGWEALVPPEEPDTPIYPTDPIEFMTKILGYQMWPKLAEIIRSVENNHNTIVSSGFGVGKSFVSAGLACWWLTTKKPAAVITLAPTWSQVNNILWRYIRQVGRKAGLPGTILDTPRWEITPDVYAYGVSPKKTSDNDMATLQGRHSPNQLIIMDEAAGLDRRIWDTVQGLCVAADNRVLAIGNPADMTSVFYEKQLSPNWNVIEISCLEHPNVVEQREVIPGAVSYAWVQERIKEWTLPALKNDDDSIVFEDQYFKPLPIFTAKVLGKTPQVADDQLISAGWITNAKNIEYVEGDIVLGVDPARGGGDDTAICIRNGNTVTKILRRKNQNSNTIVAWLQEIINETQRPITRIFIDEIGIGAGVVDLARKEGLSVYGVIFSRNALDKNKYVNLRSQCWWFMREALRLEKLALPPDPVLEGDLSSVKYGYDRLGRIELESKDAIRTRLGRSPDSGDALALTFALPWADTDYNLSALKELGGDDAEIAASRWLMSERQNGSRWKR